MVSRSLSSVNMNLLCIAMVILLTLSGTCAGHAVIRCGGFVQPSAALLASGEKADYSPISVSIVTRSGIVKETTECAPNGYYLLPIYESGEFNIQVEGPVGWHFNPTLASISTENGECNGGERVNFEISGFGVYGSVRSHSACPDDSTMDGVTIYLMQDGKQKDKYQFRGEGHSYSFQNVLPGSYDIKAVHPSWTFSRDHVTVQVNWGSVEVADDVLISGFDISGTVLSSDGDGMQKVNMNLYSERGQEAVSTTQTDNSGIFLLDNIPCGTYTLIPSYKGEHTSYDVVPVEVEIDVSGKSTLLRTPFRVVGFSANGLIQDQTGKGISGVSIFINGKEHAQSGTDGSYRLEKLSSGLYDISFVAPHLSFPDLLQQRITPNQATIPTVQLDGVDVCGRVIIDSALLHRTTRRRSIRLLDVEGREVQISQSNEKGDYCFHAVPPMSDYILRPDINAAETTFLLFDPSEKRITVGNTALQGQDFAQSKVRLEGAMTCLESPCSSEVRVKLSLIEDPSVVLSSEVVHDQFVFESVYPGEYSLVPDYEHWCWDEEEQTVSVKGKDVTDLRLHQLGYKAVIHSSHAVQVAYKHKGSNVETEIPLSKGNNEICLREPGQYEFYPQSCFKFNKDKYSWSTNAPSQRLEMNVSHYPVRGSISPPAGTEAKTLSVTVVSNQRGEISNIAVTRSGDKFTFLYWAQLAEEVEITPSSSGDLLFYPTSAKLSIDDASSCPQEMETFNARPGLFLQGKIEPVPLAGVEITVKYKNNGKIVTKVRSDAKGNYKAGPLYDHLEYTSEAHLEGYYFTSSPNGFKAVELSRIIVHALDQHGETIPGVLLSLTGDAAFYRDSDTNEHGSGIFEDLFPGEYYLRAMLKEYTFKPTNILIELGEGIDQRVTINATRVAYSAYGTVSSLSGDAEKNVVVCAQSVHGDYEETQTNVKGQFRLRGLKPALTYEIFVKPTEKIERASPSTISLDVENEDVRNVDFIAFRATHKIDIFGVVDTPDEYVESLSIELYVFNKKQNQQELTKTFSLNCLKFFDFTQLPEEEYTLKLLTSLNSNVYEFKESVVDIDIPKLQSNQQLENNRYFVSLQFRPSLRVQETEIHSNVSFYPLLILTGAFFVFWYRKHLQEYYKSRANPKSPTTTNSWVEHLVVPNKKKKKKRN